MITLSVSDKITEDYVTQVIPFSHVGEITAKYNYSASVFKDGYRDGAHVASLGNAMIYDFDDEAVTMDELEGFLRKNKVSAIIATSRNHMKIKGKKPACQRFRLIIPLHRPLKIPIKDYPLFHIFLARLMRIDDKIDGACKDTARFYYPNPNQEIRYINTGWILDTDILETNFKKIWQSEENKKTQKSKPQKHPKNYKPSSAMKANEMPRNTQVELKGGEIKYFYEFEYLTGNDRAACRCINPTHEDRHPSAFVGRSKDSGKLQITCVSCGQTYFIAEEKEGSANV